MANTENHDQSTLPAKRKCDLTVSEEESSVKAVKKLEDVKEKFDESREVENVVGDDGVDEEDDDENDADYEAEDARKKKKKKKKEEEEEENVVDLKGKGMMRDDKGKGKMIVEEDDDESDADDDVDDDADDSDDDSEDSDDSDEFWLDDDDDDSELENPLGEVNLDNILPSRTRNRGGGAQKGIVIADDPRDGRRNGDDSNSNA